MNQKVVIDFLSTMCNLYGSCAVLAKNEKEIVGFIRFYPAEILESYDSFDSLCIQHGQKWAIKPGFDPKLFPNMKDLQLKDLFIQCLMVGKIFHENSTVSVYKGTGISKQMIKILITWGKRHGWHKIKANAINHIKPLLLWTGMHRVERYKELRF